MQIFSLTSIRFCFRGGQLPSERNDIINLRKEVEDLEAKENALERLIHGAEKDLRELSADRQFAYVTYHDLRSVAAYKDQAIMAVKAPPEATLHVPRPINNFGQPKVVKCYNSISQNYCKDCHLKSIENMYTKL